MKRKILVIVFALCLAPLAAQTDEPQKTSNATAGAAIGAGCASCHGNSGISSQAGIPHVAGQHADYIRSALMAYKSGKRKDQKMQAAAASFSDQDIANVAAYYASLEGFNARPKEPGGTSAVEADKDPFAAVKKLTAMCAGCHGEDGNSPVTTTPSLAGQHDVYLLAATEAYQKEARAEPMMQALTKSLTRSQAEDIAYYYAAMVPRQAGGAPKGDPLAGMAAAAPCASCHGGDGNSTDPKNPRLAGLSADYLVAAINAYKDGSRKNDLMRNQVIALRDQEIQDLAAYYASKEPQALAIRKPLTIAEWNARCSRCHGSNGNSTDSRFPVLAGQNEAYLAKAIGQYHTGERENELMFAMSFLMSKSDVDKLAAFYSQQRKE
jgi:cytochrome c553